MKVDRPLVVVIVILIMCVFMMIYLFMMQNTASSRRVDAGFHITPAGLQYLKITCVDKISEPCRFYVDTSANRL